MSSRGVLYITWGEQRGLIRSCQSLQRHHPELPRKIVKLDDTATLMDKAKMFDLSPYDETLFLDADTVVMGRLDYAFDMAARFGIACCICECPWARRYGGLKTAGDLIEYNTGVIAFTRKAQPVFDRWKTANKDVDSSILFYSDKGLRVMPENDQAGFAVAIAETGMNPFVLPLNWNLRPTWQKSVFGPIKIWHDYSDIPDKLEQWSDRQSKEGTIIECAML